MTTSKEGYWSRGMKGRTVFASGLIKRLQKVIDKYGDMPVLIQSFGSTHHVRSYVVENCQVDLYPHVILTPFDSTHAINTMKDSVDFKRLLAEAIAEAMPKPERADPRSETDDNYGTERY